MNDHSADSPPHAAGFAGFLRGVLRALKWSNKTSAQDTLAELIEEREEAEIPIDMDERRLLTNVLDLRDRTIHDVMVPRADIIAVENGASLAEVIGLMTKEGHSRLPVYRGSLDDAIGMVHIKDILAWRGEDHAFKLPAIMRKVLFVSPFMQVLELLLEMRVTRSHMALVVDEYGGVDGLVTIEDLVEEIVGEIEDEHDRDEEPDLIRRPDGTFDADARATIESFEKIIGRAISDAELEDVDSLGGLVSAVAGRVPIKGELIKHRSGLEFEVLDADPRRIKRLRVRGVTPSTAEESETVL
ncbi:MAG: magnesium/cobalt efflux protein [Rhodospirillales bacterium RIFCSPLOWO2_12_FULL_58_28]|nr:MAG: magnesium/cobalt efflux protein [Rhodospirillales bacterium RIFCSPLOWO2_02_FULL_58_16]OHC77935.1 MAG: magnesium/cobalt efflux protein [Rhodospirillales bacterium RIFCSPLOWO2_12_FULL_58_28]